MRMPFKLPTRRSRHLIFAAAMLIALPKAVYGQQQQPAGVTRAPEPTNAPIRPAEEPRSCRQAIPRAAGIGAAAVSVTYVVLLELIFEPSLRQQLYAAATGAVLGAGVGAIAQLANPPCLDLSGGPARR